MTCRGLWTVQAHQLRPSGPAPLLAAPVQACLLGYKGQSLLTSKRNVAGACIVGGAKGDV